MLVNADMPETLSKIRCPALVIGGSLDRVRQPAIAQDVSKTIPGARYVEVRTGHYMAVQTPDLIAAASMNSCGPSMPDGPSLPHCRKVAP
jgi:alpha/beta hydrolase fold.